MGSVVLLRQHPHNSTQDMVGGVTLSQPDGGKDTTKKDPTTIKIQVHPEIKHKLHPKSSHFRSSRRLYH